MWPMNSGSSQASRLAAKTSRTRANVGQSKAHTRNQRENRNEKPHVIFLSENDGERNRLQKKVARREGQIMVD
jgi:hypothetical protein